MMLPSHFTSATPTPNEGMQRIANESGSRLRRSTMDKKKTGTKVKVTDLPKKAVSEEEAKKVKGGGRRHGNSTGS